MKTLFLILFASSVAFAGQSKDNGGDPRLAKIYSKARAIYQTKFCRAAEAAILDFTLMSLMDWPGFLTRAQIEYAKSVATVICMSEAREFRLNPNLVDEDGNPQLAENDGDSTVTINPKRWDEVESQPNGPLDLKVTVAHEILSMVPDRHGKKKVESDGEYLVSEKLYQSYVHEVWRQMESLAQEFARTFADLQVGEKSQVALTRDMFMTLPQCSDYIPFDFRIREVKEGKLQNANVLAKVERVHERDLEILAPDRYINQYVPMKYSDYVVRKTYNFGNNARYFVCIDGSWVVEGEDK